MIQKNAPFALEIPLDTNATSGSERKIKIIGVVTSQESSTKVIDSILPRGGRFHSSRQAPSIEPSDAMEKVMETVLDTYGGTASPTQSADNMRAIALAATAMTTARNIPNRLLDKELNTKEFASGLAGQFRIMPYDTRLLREEIATVLDKTAEQDVMVVASLLWNNITTMGGNIQQEAIALSKMFTPEVSLAERIDKLSRPILESSIESMLEEHFHRTPEVIEQLLSDFNDRMVSLSQLVANTPATREELDNLVNQVLSKKKRASDLWDMTYSLAKEVSEMGTTEEALRTVACSNVLGQNEREMLSNALDGNILGVIGAAMRKIQASMEEETGKHFALKALEVLDHPEKRASKEYAMELMRAATNNSRRRPAEVKFANASLDVLDQLLSKALVNGDDVNNKSMPTLNEAANTVNKLLAESPGGRVSDHIKSFVESVKDFAAIDESAEMSVDVASITVDEAARIVDCVSRTKNTSNTIRNMRMMASPEANLKYRLNSAIALAEIINPRPLRSKEFNKLKDAIKKLPRGLTAADIVEEVKEMAESTDRSVKKLVESLDEMKLSKSIKAVTKIACHANEEDKDRILETGSAITDLANDLTLFKKPGGAVPMEVLQHTMKFASTLTPENPTMSNALNAVSDMLREYHEEGGISAQSTAELFSAAGCPPKVIDNFVKMFDTAQRLVTNPGNSNDVLEEIEQISQLFHADVQRAANVAKRTVEISEELREALGEVTTADTRCEAISSAVSDVCEQLERINVSKETTNAIKESVRACSEFIKTHEKGELSMKSAADLTASTFATIGLDKEDKTVRNVMKFYQNAEELKEAIDALEPAQTASSTAATMQPIASMASAAAELLDIPQEDKDALNTSTAIMSLMSASNPLSAALSALGAVSGLFKLFRSGGSDDDSDVDGGGDAKETTGSDATGNTTDGISGGGGGGSGITGGDVTGCVGDAEGIKGVRGPGGTTRRDETGNATSSITGDGDAESTTRDNTGEGVIGDASIATVGDSSAKIADETSGTTTPAADSGPSDRDKNNEKWTDYTFGIDGVRADTMTTALPMMGASSTAKSTSSAPIPEKSAKLVDLSSAMDEIDSNINHLREYCNTFDYPFKTGQMLHQHEDMCASLSHWQKSFEGLCQLATQDHGEPDLDRKLLVDAQSILEMSAMMLHQFDVHEKAASNNPVCAELIPEILEQRESMLRSLARLPPNKLPESMRSQFEKLGLSDLQSKDDMDDDDEFRQDESPTEESSMEHSHYGQSARLRRFEEQYTLHEMADDSSLQEFVTRHLAERDEDIVGTSRTDDMSVVSLEKQGTEKGYGDDDENEDLFRTTRDKDDKMRSEVLQLGIEDGTKLKFAVPTWIDADRANPAKFASGTSLKKDRSLGKKMILDTSALSSEPITTETSRMRKTVTKAFKTDSKSVRQLLNSVDRAAMFEEIMKTSGGSKKAQSISAAHVRDLTGATLLKPRDEVKKATYTILSRFSALQELKRSLLAAIRAGFTSAPATNALQRYQFCFAVDNSGSMSGDKEIRVRTSLVLLMEVLRNLECQFSVLRFGRCTKEQPATLLKTMKEPFDELVGQKILEHFTFDEGTNILAGYEYALQHGFKDNRPGDSTKSESARKANDHIHYNKVIIMITDGLFPEAEAENLEAKRKMYPDVNFCVVQMRGMKLKSEIDDIIRKRLERVVTPTASNMREEITHEGIVSPNYCIIDPDIVKDMLPLFGFLLLGQMRQFWNQQSITEQNTKGKQLTNVPISLSAFVTQKSIESILPIQSIKTVSDVINAFHGVLPKPNVPKYKVSSDIKLTETFACSTKDNAIPFLDTLQERDAERLRNSRSGTDDAPNNREDLRDEIDKELGKVVELNQMGTSSMSTSQNMTIKSDQLRHACQTGAQRWMTEFEQNCASDIESLAETLIETLIPVNRYTRRRADYAGNSLHMPGVVRFIYSNYNYRKIFLKRNAGGKHDYSIVLVLDKSISMQGNIGHSNAIALLMMTCALSKIEIENFSVISFGHKVTIVKSHTQQWDQQAQLQVLSCIAEGFEETSSLDANALNVALDLVDRGAQSSRARKFVFTFTDGYGMQPLALCQAQRIANEKGIDVIAFGVGAEENGINLYYQKWITCITVSQLADALRAWHNDEGNLFRFSKSSTALSNEITKKLLMVHSGGSSSGRSFEAVERIWKENMSNKFFDSEINKLDKDRQLFVNTDEEAKGSLSVDVCFVMDCTGSMGSWIDAGKKYIRSMADAIVSRVKEEGTSCMVNLAFVAYRDYCRDRIDAVDRFYEYSNSEPVISKIAKQTAHGGGDGPEDIIGGLDAACKLNWSASARFVVLIADAPGHGPGYNNGMGDNWTQYGEPHMYDSVLKRLRDEKQVHLMFVKINSSTDQMINKFETVHYNNDKFKVIKLELRSGDYNLEEMFNKEMTKHIINKLVADFL